MPPISASVVATPSMRDDARPFARAYSAATPPGGKKNDAGRPYSFHTMGAS